MNPRVSAVTPVRRSSDGAAGAPLAQTPTSAGPTYEPDAPSFDVALLSPPEGATTNLAQGNALGKAEHPARALKGGNNTVQLSRPFRASGTLESRPQGRCPGLICCRPLRANSKKCATSKRASRGSLRFPSLARRLVCASVRIFLAGVILAAGLVATDTLFCYLW